MNAAVKTAERSTFIEELIEKIMSEQRVGVDVWGNALHQFTREMPLREREYAPIEKLAKELAGGVGRHDSQPWIAPVKTLIVYPAGKNQSVNCWQPFDTSPNYRWPWDSEDAYDRDWYAKRYPCGLPPRQGQPPIPDPEGDKLPDGSVINTPAFDEKPRLDSARIDVQAKAGYTNFSNDLGPRSDDEHRKRAELQRFDDQGRVSLEGTEPGDYWAEHDLEHRRPRQQNAADASQQPEPLKDSLDRLRGRICANCFDRYELFENQGTKTRYCCQRCRKYADNARNRGLSGTVQPFDIPAQSWETIGTTYGYEGMWAVA